MWNATCQFEEPRYNVIIHYITTAFSIPTYAVSLWVLIAKCPPYFKIYRNYLVLHILSGVVMEVYLSVFWKLSVDLPSLAMCPTGVISDYPAIGFDLFVFFMVFTGISGVFLLVFRMKVAAKAALSDQKASRLQKVVSISNIVMNLEITCTLLFLCLAYNDFRYQKEYKKGKEETFGKLPDYIYCDNCFFLPFNSTLFIVTFVFGYLSIFFSAFTAISAVIASIHYINSMKSQVSPKTIAIQKNFLLSLVVAVALYVIFLIVPLAIFLLANFVYVYIPAIGYILISMFREHGAAATFAMVATNTLLRKIVFGLFSKPDTVAPRICFNIYEVST